MPELRGLDVVESVIIGEHVGVMGQGVQVVIIVIVECVEQLHIDEIRSVKSTMIV